MPNDNELNNFQMSHGPPTTSAKNTIIGQLERGLSPPKPSGDIEAEASAAWFHSSSSAPAVRRRSSTKNFRTSQRSVRKIASAEKTCASWDFIREK